jgi:hypothetical protein
MSNLVSLLISLVALGISSVTVWLTLLRRGKLQMTRPTVVFFGYDFQPKMTAKIFMRTLLYSTSVRGKVIEGMYAKLQHGDNEETFGFWGYGETNRLVPGSGLYVSQSGVGANHHFVLSVDRPPYRFTTGNYIIEVFARIVGQQSPLKLSEIKITLTTDHATALATEQGVLFELGPDSDGYTGHEREGRGNP